MLKSVYIWKFNTKIYTNSSTSDSVLRPLLGLRPCTAPTGDFRTPNPTTLPLILGLRSAHDENADGIETKENGNGASHSPVDQRIWGSVVSRKPLRRSQGSPTDNYWYCLDRMSILDMELDRVGCYTLCVSPTWAEKLLLEVVWACSSYVVTPMDNYCLSYIFAAFFYVFGIYYNKTALILGLPD